MAKYKNYMVMEIIENGTIEDWCIGVFKSEKSAVELAKTYTPYPREDGEVAKVEVWGTDEDPDTYTWFGMVYSRNLKEPPEERKLKDLASRVFDLVAPWDREDETEESTAELIKSDPLAVIEFLLDQIENQ